MDRAEPRPGSPRRVSAVRAVRAAAAEDDAGSPEAIRERALELGVLGWVRTAADGAISVHVEGPSGAVEELIASLVASATGARAAEPAVEEVRVEGHEQFAIRGVSAGAFVVQEHAASTHHFDLRLEVDGVMRSWAVPKGPSLDPSVKRLAVQVEDHGLDHNDFEGPAGQGGVVVWDRGEYEQGGRVPWPEALDRGHGVFVLHGEKLRGGFALQRTRPGAKSQWLLIKRRDDEAQPGSDVVAERPASVLSGLTLEEMLASEG
jgi:DNA ligase D-like protein (predicted 3'-phosphoesterase)